MDLLKGFFSWVRKLSNSSCLCLLRCILGEVWIKGHLTIFLFDLNALNTSWGLVEPLILFNQNDLRLTRQHRRHHLQMRNFQTLLSLSSLTIFFCWAFLLCTIHAFYSSLPLFIRRLFPMAYLIDFVNSSTRYFFHFVHRWPAKNS